MSFYWSPCDGNHAVLTGTSMNSLVNQF